MEFLAYVVKEVLTLRPFGPPQNFGGLEPPLNIKIFQIFYMWCFCQDWTPLQGLEQKNWSLQNMGHTLLGSVWKILGAVHKRRPQSGGWVCPVRTFADKGKGGSSDADVRTFWCKKLGLFKIHGEQGGRMIKFSRFCTDVLYGQSLIPINFRPLTDIVKREICPNFWFGDCDTVSRDFQCYF